MNNFELIPAEPYPRLPMILKNLTRGIRDILMDNLVGIYIVGSLALGDFDADSDIDFLIVIENDLDNSEVEQLQEMHRLIYDIDCYPAKHLEGSYIPRHKLCNPQTLISDKFWYLDNGSRTLELSDHDNRWHVHWVLREKGIPLWGPDPAIYIKQVPAQALKDDVMIVMKLITDGFKEELTKPLAFYNSRFGQSFVILTICRILFTLHSGTIESKKAGAFWAIKNLDTKWSPLINQAWEDRKGVRFCQKIRERANQDLLLKTQDFIDYTLSFIDQNCS